MQSPKFFRKTTSTMIAVECCWTIGNGNLAGPSIRQKACPAYATSPEGVDSEPDSQNRGLLQGRPDQKQPCTIHQAQIVQGVCEMLSYLGFQGRTTELPLIRVSPFWFTAESSNSAWGTPCSS